MSAQTTVPPVPPFQQWQNFFPAGVPPYGYDNEMLQQILTTVAGNAEQTKQQAANDTARDILRTVERNGQDNMSTTERVNAQLASAVERNGALNMSATERNGFTGVNATERIGGNIMTAIERVAGEGRLTTTVTDSASRQASNDSARDILAAVERNGNNAVNVTKDTHNGLLGAIERNAGENRMTTVTVGGQNDSKLANVHNNLANQLTNMEGELLSTFNIISGDIKTGVANSAWESRTGISAGFAASALESAKNTSLLSNQASTHYASLTLENAKSDALLSNQASNQYASLLLEQQKMKEYLSAKGDNQFAMTQLELQKAKSDILTQASAHFSVNQLEQQKIRESLSAQLADAKYEALKSQQFLADKMSTCCCEVKEKIDLVDRDRLRDNLNTATNDNNLLKLAELAGEPRFRNGFPFGGYGPYVDGPAYGYGPFGSQGHNNTHIYTEERGRRSRRRHSRSRSRSRSSDRGSRH